MSIFEKNRLSELIVLAMSETITLDQVKELNQHLREDEQALDLYMEIMEINSQLAHKSGVASDVMEGFSSQQLMREYVELDESIASERDKTNRQKLEKTVQAKAKEKLDAYMALQKTDKVNPHLTYNTALAKVTETKNLLIRVGALAACLLVCVVSYFLLNNINNKSVAKIINQYQSQWLNEPGELITKTIYTLESGFSEIEFNDGAKIILEGPSEIVFESANGAYLKRGKLVANVPPQAYGFIVNTPGATIVDIGTQFGVFVDDQMDSQLTVFKGAVELALKGDDQFQQVESGKTTKITYHDKLIKDVTPQEMPERFSLRLPNDSKPFEKNFTNLKNCLKDLETYYYLPLDSQENIDAIEGVDASHVDFTPRAIGGFNYKSNHAAQFNSHASEIMIHAETIFNQASPYQWRNGFTLSFWLKPGHLEKQMTYDVVNFNQFKIYIERSMNDKLVVTADYVNKDKQEGGYTLVSSTDFEMEEGQWTHVVFSINSEEINLFMNGFHQEASKKIGQYAKVNDQLELIQFGSKLNYGMSSSDVFFVLDDIILAQYFLRDDDIECLILP